MLRGVLDRFSLAGEVAVVTGASGNLGPIWIKALVQAGARVFGLDLPGVEDARLDELVRANAGAVALCPADVLDKASLESALGECRSAFGEPTVLVNNAGIDQPPAADGGGYRLEDIPFGVNMDLLAVNSVGLFQACQVFGSAMAENGKGAVINIGSLYASVAPDSRLYDHIETDPPFLKPPFYGASKAAVVNLTRYLATLWADRNVRVNALSPGGVLGGQDEEFKRKFTARTPLGRMAEEGDLVGPLVFLASRASSYVTGMELVVDGGFTCW